MLIFLSSYYILLQSWEESKWLFWTPFLELNTFRKTQKLELHLKYGSTSKFYHLEKLLMKTLQILKKIYIPVLKIPFLTPPIPGYSYTCVSSPLDFALLLFPALFTVMKPGKKVPAWMCINQLHLHIKTFRWKVSRYYGMNFPIHPGQVVNHLPHQQWVQCYIYIFLNIAFKQVKNMELYCVYIFML